MNTENQVPEAVEPVATTVPIESIDQFAHLMISWHENAVATVKHLAQAPEGMEVIIGQDEPFKLEGDTYHGFKLGLELALNFLGTMPFAAEHEPAESIQ